MLLRDIANLASYFGQFAPELLTADYGLEIWSLYESGKLHPAVALTGRVERNDKPVDLALVMREIDAVIQEEAQRQRYRQETKE
ncbi:MAG: RIO kinase 1, partial [Halothiobacillaceae bacterium]